MIIKPFFSQGKNPFETVEWEKEEIKQFNFRENKEEVIGVFEFPKTWNETARKIVSSKYFRKGKEYNETSLKQVVTRITETYGNEAFKRGYLTQEQSKILIAEMQYAMIHQLFAFNSPVWFNVGVPGRKPQVSACFLLKVEDSLDGILEWIKEEGKIFSLGSGAGVNISSLRAEGEPLSGGGTTSGPISFMRGADASAGSIKSGGSQRRAAKMVIMDVNHPDIEEFVKLKSHEENKIRVLKDNGFDMEFDGKDSFSVQYQNANNSVRVDDKFMEQVVKDGDYELLWRKSKGVAKKVSAKKLFREIATAAWECADPGIQFQDTINKYHTNKDHSEITTSNPCSEYLSISNSSCNLGSFNLAKFLVEKDNQVVFDIESFSHMVRLAVICMDVSVSFGFFPTEKITQNTRDYRQLGIGVTNLGAALMSLGLAYDSEKGRNLAASINSLMSAVGWETSAEIASEQGAYNGFANSKKHHHEVIGMHRKSSNKLMLKISNEKDEFSMDIAYEADNIWGRLKAEEPDYRNAQISLAAPTGTISFALGADTTGIEPDFSLIKYKKMVNGSSMVITNETVSKALNSLGYKNKEIEEIVKHIKDNMGSIEGSSIKKEHESVFSCATGYKAIEYMGHIEMMAAIQPFLSGAISKTVNLPKEATIEDIENVYLKSWEKGLKAVAVYRDQCKVGQPLSSVSDKENKKEETTPTPTPTTVRNKMSRTRNSKTTSFSVGGAEGYLIVGEYSEGELAGKPGEIFIKLGKQGTTLSGILDAFSISTSINLQYGVPLKVLAQKFISTKFEPAGMTDDKDLRFVSSLLDYVFRRLCIDYLTPEECAELGVFTNTQKVKMLEEKDDLKEKKTNKSISLDAPNCKKCGSQMTPSGACFICSNCGESSGCS